MTLYGFKYGVHHLIWFPLKLQGKFVIELVELKKLKGSDGKMS